MRYTLLCLAAAAVIGLTACNAIKSLSIPPTVAARPAVTARGFECPPAEFDVSGLSGELNLLVRTEFISAEIPDCFELMSGVTIHRREYSTNEEILDRVTAGDADYDLVLIPDYIVDQLIRQVELSPIDSGRLPLARNLDPDYLNFSFDPGNQFSLPYQAGSTAIVVNADEVRTLPGSWADLWDARYADRLVFVDDSRTVIGVALLTLGYDVNTTDPAQLEAAGLKLRELVPNVRLFDNDSPKTLLGTGAVDLGITWSGEAFLARRRNPAIQYVYPAEGAIVWQDNWAIPSEALNPDAAYAFLNYSMQANVFWVTLRDFPYIVPNRAALAYARDQHGEIYQAYVSSPITNMPGEAIVNSHRIGDVGEALALYYEIWAELRRLR